MPGIVVMGGRTLSRNRKIHGNGAAERSGPHRTRGNILVRLPENNLIRGAAFTRAADDFAHAGKPKVDAVLGASFELKMNPATDTFAGRKRQRIELEVRVAEAPVLHGGARGLDD